MKIPFLAGALALVAAAALPGAVIAPASAEASWVVNGKGFGHGAGMSQWGAFGRAQNGRGYRQILGHYYSNTRVGTIASRQVRVLLGTRPQVRFTRANRACGRGVKPGREYIFRGGSTVALLNANGKRLTGCGQQGRARGAKPLRIFGYGGYRGSLIGRADGSGLMVINALALDAYIRGVVANEMPASWHLQALRSQAVAARSYGIATSRSGPFDHYADTRSQVYGGLSSETKRTNRAVKDTRREVVRHNGNVVVTYFYSSSGGRTESVEYVWGGSPAPYLKSVGDAPDSISPHHSWTRRFTAAQMQSALGDLVPGSLRRIRVTQTGDSPRIVRARLVGSQGNGTASGATLRARLGLPSTWARFSRE